MKRKTFQRVLTLALFAISTMAFADCVDALDTCYKWGGSDEMCNAIYTACLQPPAP